jgi:hypothetical protein
VWLWHYQVPFNENSFPVNKKTDIVI